MKVAAFMLFVAISGCCLRFVVSTNDCNANPEEGDLFEPWDHDALSRHSCKEVRTDRGGSCVGDAAYCTTNEMGHKVDTNPRRYCSDLINLSSALCCTLKTNCSAQPILSSGAEASGSCILSSHCTSAISPSPNCNEDLSCCVPPSISSPISEVACSKYYKVVYNRIGNVIEKFCHDSRCISKNRLTNFLPFAMKVYDDLHDNRCARLGDCAVETYTAFIYYMLHDFTFGNVTDVLSQMLFPNALPESVSNLVKAEIERFEGHMVPSAFGEVMRILWTNSELNLVQFNGGTCADWLRLANTVRGPNHDWKCDDKWIELTNKTDSCRPKKQSNLADCSSGEGVCYINGNSLDACSSVGLAELPSGHSSCQSRYGVNSFCCEKKTNKTLPRMSFSHNEYYNVRVAIDPTVEEDAELIEDIMEAFAKASHALYTATEERAVFRSIRIILPDSWTSTLANHFRTSETPEDSEFIIWPDISWQKHGISPNRSTMTTFQIGNCGRQGFGTRMTPRDIRSQLGPENIAKHFSINRYGIFREYPISHAEIESALKNPQRCSRSNETYYQLHNETLDVFVSNTSNKVTASLAWLPDYQTNEHSGLKKTTVNFCSSVKCDEARFHNDRMDNTHNKICEGRPTLDVILDHEDFIDTPPRPGLDPTPEFIIVHPRFLRQNATTTPLFFTSTDFADSWTSTLGFSDDLFKTKGGFQVVLMLDVSDENKNYVDQMKHASMTFIDKTDESVDIGLIAFNDEPEELMALVAADADGKIRLKAEINEIDSKVGGGRCVVRAEKLAIAMLKKDEDNNKPEHVLPVTKGESETCTFGSDSSSHSHGGVSVYSVMLKKSNPALEATAHATGGKSYLVADPTDVGDFSRQLEAALIAMTAKTGVTERLSLLNKKMTVRGNRDNDVRIFLDQGLGSSTLISVMYKSSLFNSIDGTVIPPTSSNNAQVDCEDQPEYGLLNCWILFKPDKGDWTVRIHPLNDITGDIQLTVSATINKTETDTFKLSGLAGKDKRPPVKKSENGNFSRRLQDMTNAQPLVAIVSYGRYAVLNASVTATITFPNATQRKQQLFDNGAATDDETVGLDLYKDDGVYSGLFTQDDEEGTYSVAFDVVASDDSTFYSTDVLVGIPYSGDPSDLTSLGNSTYVTFERELSIGTFEIVFDEPPLADCFDDNKDGSGIFFPWDEYTLSKFPCQDVKTGSDGSCTSRSHCNGQQGSIVETNPADYCESQLLYSECCHIANNCTAQPVTVSGARPEQGVCLAPGHCTSAVATTSDCDTGLTCCVASSTSTDGTKCSDHYKITFKRLQQACFGSSSPCLSDNRITNFLPFALNYYDLLSQDKSLQQLGDCVPNTYLASFYHLLEDFTFKQPESVLTDILTTIPISAADDVKEELGKFEGYISPEAFSQILKILWKNQELNLAQFNTGTCADWIRLADAIRGPNHDWKCDAKWTKLVNNKLCRATDKSNLVDCGNRNGVCYINGDMSGVCESVGLAELEPSSTTDECQQFYNTSKAFCCRKHQVSGTTLQFYHNEYYNVRVAIDPRVKEDSKLLEQIKATFTEASNMLYTATFHRASFRTVLIMVPEDWDTSLIDEFQESSEKVSFTILPDIAREDDKSLQYGVTIRTIQIGECGSTGAGTFLTPRDLISDLGPANIAKHFAFDRYGIFSEFPRTEEEMLPFDVLRDGPPRCAKEEGTTYLTCNGTVSVAISNSSNQTASIAWLPDSRRVMGAEHIVHFCDRWVHNEDMENTQNRICSRRATMEVIGQNDDFSRTGTPPRSGLVSSPEFKIIGVSGLRSTHGQGEISRTVSVRGVILKPPIRKIGMDFGSIKPDYQVIVATVSAGPHLAVLEADLTAEIEDFDSGEKWPVPLADDGSASKNGVGADLYEHDGIYSGQLKMSEFANRTGRYWVRIKAEDVGKAFYVNGVLVGQPVSSDYLAKTIGMRAYVSFYENKLIENKTFEMFGDDVDRTPFTFPGKPGQFSLVGENTIDNQAVFTFTWIAVGRQGMDKGAPSYYMLNASTLLLDVEGRSDEIEINRKTLGRLVDFAIVDGSDDQMPGVPMLSTIQLPLSKWKDGTKVYFSVTAYNYEPEIQRTVAGLTSNVIISRIKGKTIENGVCDKYHCKN